jgi:hypothetical protein
MDYECVYRVSITLNAEMKVDASDGDAAAEVAGSAAMKTKLRDDLKRQLAAYAPIKVEIELTDVVEV